MTSPAVPTAPARLGRRRALMLAPLGVVALGGVAFWKMLAGMQNGSFDPRGLNSMLLGHAVPPFVLPAQAPAMIGFSSADITAEAAAHGPLLVNFFASWCVPCIVEAPELLVLHRQGLRIWGIAYKDTEDAAGRFLAQRGNPFDRLARDAAGRVAIDWGVYGVPETYFIDRQGIVRWRWAGPLGTDIVAQQLRPLFAHYT